MKKFVVTIIILLTLGPAAQGKKLGSFSEVYFKRPMLRLDDKHVYIVDQGLKKGYIYDRTNLKKVAEFGKKGQGPGEFISITYVSIDDEYIYISTFPKLCIFSKEGKLIKELKGPAKTGKYIPLGKNFVGTFYLPSLPDDDYVKTQIRLFDANLQKKKDLLLTKIHSFVKFQKGKEIIYKFPDCVESVVYKDKLYVGSTEKGFYFAVFNSDGEKLFDIKKEENKRRFTEEEKGRIRKAMKIGMGEENWKIFNTSKELIFGDYYPSYKAFFVNDDNIYVFRYPLQNGLYEILIFSLKGELIKKKFMSIMDCDDVESKYSFIYKGKLYQMRETEEEWELHEVELL
jgi:hypothetical protein